MSLFVEEYSSLSTRDEIEKSFRWVSADFQEHDPSEMQTRHIFFTLRMIWNHSAPERFRIEPYKRYEFSAFYTEAYMAEAVYVLSKELSRRDDLKPYFKKCLDYMAKCLEELSLIEKLK